MNSSDITNTVIIIIIFAIINIASVLGIGIQHIKDNWNEYKCMPAVIPFAGYFGHNSMTTFNECMHGVLSEFISDMLGPIYDIFQELSTITSQIGNFMSIYSNITGMFKLNFLNILLNVYQIGTKLLLGITEYAVKLQDMINRLAGIFMVIIYIILGANLTVLSIWNGLPGQIVKYVINM